jgi:hypothetical protein
MVLNNCGRVLASIRRGFALFGRRQGRDNGFDCARPERDQFFQCFLRQRAARIAAGFNLGDEPIGTIIGE